MYGRFTDAARKAMQLADQEAMRFNRERIASEHILLGLVKQDSGVAVHVLTNLGLDVRRIQIEVETALRSAADTLTRGQVLQRPQGKRIIEFAMEESHSLKHNYVGTEHLLLGLLRHQEGVAARVLTNLGLSIEDVREEVRNLKGRGGAASDHTAIKPGQCDDLLQRGRAVLPGGVCSSTRFNQAWGRPVYASRAKGPRFWTADGRELLDMSMSHGAALLGHAPECLKAAFEKSWELGVMCSLDSPWHVELAEKLCRIVPCGERVRFTGSGSEATLHALRLCRAVSGRDKIMRFFGHFHGYHEFTYIGGHPPADRLDARPPYRESAGIPAALAELVIPVEYNDAVALEAAVRRHRDEAGTILIEPVDYNCGCILPEPGFLEHARRLADEYGMILFFDEIQSFAKKNPGGAQQDFAVTPDICTIGKSLGAGLPLSAILGKAALMDRFAPLGDVAHSGTFNAPLPSILAGLAFVEEIGRDDFWTKMRSLGERLYAGLDDIAARSPVPVRFQRHGSRFGIIFGTREPVRNYREALVHRRDWMLEFCRRTSERGVYFHDYGGAACHHGYSLAHEPTDIDQVLNVVADALAATGRSGR